MATLTYDSSEAQPGELSAEEQDSLAVGESMEQQQQQLLAGKFKDAEDLEKAYIELQSKLGSKDEQVQTPNQGEEGTSEEPEASDNFLSTLWEEAQGQEFSKETVERLENMNPGELAKMYLDEKQAQTQNYATEKDAQELRNLVGGDDSYKQLVGWASENFSKEEVGMYDAIMNGGDRNAMYFAVQALSNRYQQSNSVEGQLLTGKSSPPSGGEAFRSQAEVVRAMSDPRYDSDPAYRQDVAAKLERSNIDF